MTGSYEHDCVSIDADSLTADRSIASSKARSGLNAIQVFLFLK